MFGVDIGDDFVLLLLLARAALNASKSIVSASGNGAALAEEGSMRLLQIVADAPITSRRLIDFVLICPPCDSAVANELMRGRINSIAIMIVVYKARIYLFTALIASLLYSKFISPHNS